MGEGGDLSQIKAIASAQVSDEEALRLQIEALQKVIEDMDPTLYYAGIKSTFEGVASQIETALNKLEVQQMYLTINWDTAGSEEAIQALRDILEYYGWEDEVTLTFISVMLENFAGNFEEKMDILKFVTGDSGWESTATMMMLSDDTFWNTNTWEENLRLIGFINSETGGQWDSKAVLTFLANESAWDSTTFEQAMDGLGFLLNQDDGDWNSPAVVTWMANDGVWDSMTFENRMDFLKFVKKEGGWYE